MTDAFMRVVLKLLHRKPWKTSRKIYVIEFRFNKIVRLHSTACYRIKNSTTDTFLEVLRKEKMFQNFNIFNKKKPLQNGPFSLKLPVYSSEFPA